MENSPNFNPEWVRSIVQNWTEGPRIDFKQCVPHLGIDERAKCKFVRHVIAFANTANRINGPCWIFFGVDDRNRKLIDIREQSPMRRIPGWWHNPEVSIHRKQIDGVLEVYQNIISQWIEPMLPDFKLEYGKVDDIFVSYLEIEPTQSSSPFKLSRSFGNYPTGTVFVRKGSSSVPLASSEEKYLISYKNAEYLDRGKWKNIILTYLSGKFETMYFLQPLFYSKANGEQSTAIEIVLEALDNGIRSILIVGNAGEGKTVLLHRIAYLLANRHNVNSPTSRDEFGDYMGIQDDVTPVISVKKELEVIPVKPIPVFVELRTYFDKMEDLDSLVLKQISDAVGDKSYDSIEKLLNIPGSKWVILLDGVDEIRNREAAGAILSKWIHLLPNNVQVVISTRPYARGSDNVDFEVELEKLTQQDILFLIKGKIIDIDPEHGMDVFLQIKEFIQNNPDLIYLINRHRALDGLVKYCIGNYSPPTTIIDQDRVDIIEAISFSTQESGKGPIPVISSQEFQFDGTFQIYEYDEPEVLDFKSPDLNLALSLQQVTEYLRVQEIKRQEEFGQDAKRVAAIASYELGATAWLRDWTQIRFDSTSCEKQGWISKRSLNWNEFIGFILCEEYPDYAFWTPLFAAFIAAEFAFYRLKNKEEIKNIISKQDINNPLTHKVYHLYNQLRIMNGKDELLIKN